jgi:putative zinc finger protein
MRECLDEEILQSYLDGELSLASVENITSHLAICSNCSAFAREVEKENSVVAAALSAEFEGNVPSERLRQRLETAIAGRGSVNAGGYSRNASTRGSGWLQSLSGLFVFTPQRAFGYAGLIVVLTFAAIMAVIQSKGRQPTSPSQGVAVVGPPATDESRGTPAPEAPAFLPAGPKTIAVAHSPRRPRKNAPALSDQSSTAAHHVKLLPGERSYLQTIAELDSTIKSEKGQMKPAIQAEYQRNLAFVDRALAAARTAAKDNPNDPDAAGFMFSAYQSKVDLLNTVADARAYNRQR